MASRDWNDGAVLEVTWSQKLTDFTIKLKSGTVKVHKHVLAENSLEFEQRLIPSTTKRGSERSGKDPKDMRRIRRRIQRRFWRCYMKYFDQAIVISLLEYMYAGKINDPETIETIRYGHFHVSK